MRIEGELAIEEVDIELPDIILRRVLTEDGALTPEATKKLKGLQGVRAQIEAQDNLRRKLNTGKPISQSDEGIAITNNGKPSNEAAKMLKSITEQITAKQGWKNLIRGLRGPGGAGGLPNAE